MTMITVTTWLLTPVLTLKWGFNGAALASFLTGFVSLWSIKKCFQEVKINFFENIRSAFWASLVMGISVYLLGRFWVASFFQLLLVVGFGALVYTVIFYLLEKERLPKEIKSFLGKDFNLAIFSFIRRR